MNLKSWKIFKNVFFMYSRSRFKLLYRLPNEAQKSDPEKWHSKIKTNTTLLVIKNQTSASTWRGNYEFYHNYFLFRHVSTSDSVWIVTVMGGSRDVRFYRLGRIKVSPQEAVVWYFGTTDLGVSVYGSLRSSKYYAVSVAVG